MEIPEKISTNIYNSPDGGFYPLDYFTLQPLVKPNLDLLFIGINPHPKGVEKGAYFSNSGALWNQLAEVGITDKRINCKDMLRLNIGITNIVLKPSITSLEVTKEDLNEGKKRLIKEIEYSNPKVICFIGKLPYLGLTEKKKCEYGWQKEPIINAKGFVMIFPTFRCAKKKKIEILNKLTRGSKNLGIKLPKRL